MSKNVAKEYLLNIKDKYRKKSNSLGKLYELQNTVGNEKNSRLDLMEKNNLLEILDSRISSVEYNNLKDNNIDFSSENNMAYLGDMLKNLYDNTIYDIKNKIVPPSHKFYKTLFGLDKGTQELNYKRNIDYVIHSY
jgi:hypothetical protein